MHAFRVFPYGLAVLLSLPASAALTLEERVDSQRALERILWERRTWPGESLQEKTPFAHVATDEMLRRKAEESLRKSEALRVLFDREITAEQLQRELDRMAAHTKDPALLRALFAALGDDPVRIAESLVRPILADRLLRRAHGAEGFDAWWDAAREHVASDASSAVATLTLPEITGSSCDDAWSPTFSDVPAGMGPASWTGTEMIFWGDGEGSRYDPATDSWTVMSRFGAPSRRSNHTAVWTGTDLIVWGGHITGANDVFFDTGARYSPATDTWTPMSVAGAPTGRRDHSAVWTGSQMIVWGGQGPGNTYVQTGGRYSPATDTWTATTTTGAPAGTSNHTAVWTGSQMIVWGDTGGARYTPSSNTWSTLATNDAPTLRSWHTAVWTGSEMIVWGGLTGTGITQTGARYTPQMNKWRATITTGAPAARFQHGAVWTGTHMVVFGGNGNTGGRYSPQSDSWLPVATTGAPGGDSWTDPAMAWTGTEVLVYAGQGGRYDPSGNAWSTLTVTGETPSPRLGPTAVWTGAEFVLWGGIVGNTVLGTGARYLPALDAWLSVTTAGAPLARRNHTGVWTGTEMIVWGGDNPTFPGGYLDTGARYDPLTETWTPTTTTGAPSARRLHTATWAGTHMMVWGGESAPLPAPYLATGALYDPATDSWSPTSLAGAPSGRLAHTAVRTGSEVIVWGGSAADGQLASPPGRRYAPETNVWTALSTINAPSGSSGPSAVWTGTDMILFPGNWPNGRRYRPSTNTWFFLQGNDGLGQRSGVATAWTGIHMLVWGGSVGSQGSRYNAYAPLGAAFSPMTSLGAPSESLNLASAWTGQSLIVWGGGSSAGGVYCSCTQPATLYRDEDGDGYGTTEPGFSFTGCAGVSAPTGYVFAGGDCNDASTAVHPGIVEACNGIDDDCSGAADDDADGVDTDLDGIRNACDTCPLASDPEQHDADHDGEGDLCDPDDGLVFLFARVKEAIDWHPEAGATSWNVYEADLGILRASGEYTQAPGSNVLADRHCGVVETTVPDPESVPAGMVKIHLVTEIVGGIEGGLGQDGAGNARPNAHPCP